MADQFSTGIVKAVRFSFMTDKEVEKLSFQKIRNPILLDTVGRPTPEGLYDPALGPLDDNTPCKTCGQLSRHCTGHCGHIDLVSDVYNPLLFTMLFKILQKTCFFCHHFKVKPSEVDVCVSKLELIKKGCIVAARKLDKDSGVAGLVELSEEDLSGGCGSQIHLVEQKWTSLQQTEVMSVLNYFLMKSKKKCQRCGRQSPAISKPTFGWIYMSGKSDWHDTSEPLDDGDDKSASEVEDPDGPASSQGGESRRERKTSAARSAKKSALSKQTMLDGPENLFMGQKNSRSLWPIEVRKILKGLWSNEAQLCDLICNIQLERPYASWKNAGYSMFFLKKILVPPIKFRPPTKGGDSVMEHVQTVLLVKVLESNISLGNACENHAAQSTIVSRWKELQQSVNILFDSKNAAGQGQKDAAGICQQLERKEGVFRQKMMGKRVNFACRSVISPDPYLAVNEIGLPPYFALRLTYPERVTPWNVTMLRDAVINGPETHPGATHYIDKSSILLKDRKSRIAISRKLLSSRGGVIQPGRNCNYELESKVVYRHIRNGDIVLVNRQPTLHKPSIIALRVRVLPGEKTLRMHYANCDSFNADFDGDEINVHFPQDEISRSEGYNIVNADDQYIVPTRGDPKRALIQDHIVGAVLLTKRDTFLTWDEFSLLLYSSGLCSDRTSPKPGQRVSLTDSIELIASVPPAILKPCRLWTGKQVITAILQHITRDQVPFAAKKRAKIAREYFGKDNAKKKNDGTSTKRKPREDCSESIDEDVVFIYKNELVQGVIDKEQFGKFGLVHTVQELYGSSAAGNLLSVLGRVLTTFLQLHGFTCGVDDLLLVSDYDRRRKQLLDVSLNCGDEVHLEFVGCQKEQLGTKEMQIEVEKAIRRNGESAVAILDGMMRNKLNSANSSLSKLFPDGLSKPFRQNCLSLMTLSGAKGGTFNFQQISLLLGQQELEGKRVPRMVSGKTLPCFPAWDTAARAGGFISDRYLTGLRPQEFYFHCMAGREGLVDTAVKTSRSGYLQRCLIKNLESLQVNYDYTVRDADGSIIQFRYGEDGVDVHQKNFIQEFDALAMNKKIFWKSLLGRVGDGCMSKYIEEDNEFPDVLSMNAEEFLKDEIKARNYGIRRRKDRVNFVNLVKSKYFMSLAQPGEPVGVIAAQSVGEPSTQMTLNTFHHAGRGEMNVTLGIPRLQEIIMTASANIRTPTMTCPLLKSKSKDDAECVAANLRRVTVADIIENIQVCVVPFATSDDRISSLYKLMIKLYKPDLYPPNTDISLEDCKDTLETVFLRALEDAIQNHLLLLSKISGIKNFIGSQPKASDEAEDNDPCDEPQRDAAADDDDNDDNEGGGDDLGLDAQRSQQQATDEVDYEDASDDEHKEEYPTSELETEADQGGANDSDENSEQDEPQRDSFVRSEKENLENKAPSKHKSNKVDRSQAKEGKQRRRLVKKETDRAVYMSSDGLQFEVHFEFMNEPHILLSEIVQKTARKVYVKRAGKIDQCKVVELHLDDPKVGGIPMLRKGKETRPALQTSGVDFVAFWRMQDILDINCISTNDVDAMLNTYGVEAARATIITEVFRVFNHYGVSVDMRHLCLIADFMTHAGEYRALNRTGRIKDSTSPFGKMSFETASRFIVEAATHGQEDTLDTPSARICLGLPPKVGTGCFDLLQKLDI